MSEHSVLIIEDDPILRRIALQLLASEGYQVLEAEAGGAGLTVAFTASPDLVLLDRGLPDMDGIEVLRTLRAHFFTNHIPVILLTSRDQVEDRVEGLGSGADDYVCKPFDKRELLARVAAAVRRSQRSLGADPLTKLPGNQVLREHLRTRIEAGRPTALVYVDLDNFKAYVDGYGFEAAAHVIQKAAQVQYNAVIDHGDPGDFVGHLGGDDFLLICAPERAETLARRVVEEFDARSPEFYDEADREQGFIDGKDRYGAQRRFPLVSLSAAIIDVPEGADPDPLRLAEFAAQCKTAVKKDRGEGWRRFDYAEPS